jgi:hypothetical protein
MHLRPGFRIAAHASFANLHDKRAKIPQLYSVTAPIAETIRSSMALTAFFTSWWKRCGF